MNEYTASNGARIKLEGAGEVVMWATDIYPDWRPIGQPPYPDENPGYGFTSLIGVAVREFYRHKEDERLGRWRWPEIPEYIAYDRGDYVQIIHEPSGASGMLGTWTREDAAVITPDSATGFALAAHAFFDAHPEPKPWHNAKPGEVWVVTIDGHSRPHYVQENRDDTVGGIAFVAINPTHGQPGHVGVKAPAVSDARRIYPEGD